MYELLEQLLRHARGIWRFRWSLMVTAWVTFVGAGLFIEAMPDEYRASATVHVDTQTVLRPLLRGLAVSSDANQRVKMMTRTLVTRPNLEKLARMTDLDLRAGTPEEMEALLDSLAKRIRITTSRRGENLYTISFTDSDRGLAKRVVQSLLTIFVESSLGQSREDTDTAQKFLDQQIAEYERKLNEAEARLADFKRKNVGMMPGEGRDYYARLQSAQADLEAARLQLRELQNRRAAQLQQLQDLEDDESSLGIYQDTSGAGSAIDARIQSLQSRLDELLLRFTEQHPDVIETRRLIENLEKKRDAEAMERAETAPPSNPLYQQMQMVLTETEAQIASMRARVSEYEARVRKLQEMVDTVPKVEAELQRLNRDYAVHKKNYEQLLARREQASISEQAEISADDVKFRVVEPPRVPLAPSGPNRILLMTFALLGALAAGAAVAFVLSQIRPTFDDSRQLKEVTGLPVFGTVSMVYTDQIRRRRRLALASFAVAVMGLFLLYGAFMVVELLDLDLPRQLRVL